MIRLSKRKVTKSKSKYQSLLSCKKGRLDKNVYIRSYLIDDCLFGLVSQCWFVPCSYNRAFLGLKRKVVSFRLQRHHLQTEKLRNRLM